MKFTRIFGVDFSGAKQAGRNTWIASVEAHRRRLRLRDLQSLESLCGTAEREDALKYLVDLVAGSRNALWGMDFPFGLPIEVIDAGHNWIDQLRTVKRWIDGANGYGLHCLNRAKQLGGKWHIRRSTDSLASTPFDCYHYRIIYQTFHGMRDVLEPLSRRRGVAILPFQYARLARAQVVVVEACPGSTLKRLKIPHQRYKQPAGGPLTSIRHRTRHDILAALTGAIEIDAPHRRLIMRNPGGDALDAVIAAVGAHQAFGAADHRAIATHPRYPLEGYLYC